MSSRLAYPPGGGGSGSPGGADGDVQYKSGASFAAEAAFNYDAATNQLTVPGETITEDLSITGDISPTQITADQNDYAPTNFATSSVLRLSSDAARNITGLAGGSDGRLLLVHNVGSNSITLKDENAGSTAGNRFALLSDVILQADDCVLLYYDSTSSRWRCLGRDSKTVRTDQANTYTAGAQDFGSATSLKVPASGGAAPTADGLIAYDTTQDCFVAGGGTGAQTGKLPRVLSVQRSTTDTLDAATIGTTETAFATTFSIPANFFIAQKCLRIRVHFEVDTSASAPNFTLRMRVQKTGPTNVNLYQSATAGPGSNSITDAGVGAEFIIQGTGAPGAAVAVETGTLSHVGLGGAFPLGRNTIAQGVNIDTTAAQTLQFTLQFGAGTAGNVVTLRQLIIEELN